MQLLPAVTYLSAFLFLLRFQFSLSFSQYNMSDINASMFSTSTILVVDEQRSPPPPDMADLETLFSAPTIIVVPRIPPTHPDVANLADFDEFEDDVAISDVESVMSVDDEDVGVDLSYPRRLQELVASYDDSDNSDTPPLNNYLLRLLAASPASASAVSSVATSVVDDDNEAAATATGPPAA